MVLRKISLSIFLFASLVNAASRRTYLSDENESNLVVETNVGSIRGLRAEDGDYSMYMGIPFAEVDSDNVFGPSKPYPKFEDTFDAFDDSAICPQVDEVNNTIVGSLDCLHLNVYVPNTASANNKLPVLVWIYGGGFSIGYGGRFLYGPKFLVRHDVIFVTLNYRLGPYGFMCLDSPEVPGNQGLRDQVIALKWINENIGAFGGDNNKVTLFGNSAGGMSIEMHLYYGKEENLFQKIIPQSGSVLMTGVVTYSDYEAPFKLAEHLNHKTEDLREALSFLATVNTDDVIAAANELGLAFTPCIEKEFENIDTYVTKHPLKMDLPRAKDVEVLVGFNNEEIPALTLDSFPDLIFSLEDFVGIILNTTFNFEGEGELYNEMREVVTHFYFGDSDIISDSKQELSNMLSDLTFNHAALRSVQKYLDNGIKTLYLYLFSYNGGRNLIKERLNATGTGNGAAHADEVGYLFDISYLEKPMDPEDELIVDRMTEMWANFAKYGNPTPAVTELIPVHWPSVTRDKWHYLELDSDLKVSTRPFHRRMAFLDLFFKKNEQYLIGMEEDPVPEPEPEITPAPTDPPEETTPEPSGARNIVLEISLPILFVVKYFI